MKHTNFLKQQFLTLLGIMVVFLILFGCQQDDFVKKNSSSGVNQQTSSGFKMKKMTSKDIERNLGLSRALQKFTAKEMVQGRSMEFPEYGFRIDTESFMLIEDESNRTISYTFEILQEDEYRIQNLVLKPTDSENYIAYIVEYELTENELDYIRQGYPLAAQVPVSVMGLSEYSTLSVGGNGADCVEMDVFSILMCPDAFGNLISTMGNEVTGDCHGQEIEVPHMILTVDLGCLNGGGTPGTPVQQIDFGPGGSGGSGGTPTQNPNNPGKNNLINPGNSGGIGFSNTEGNVITTPVRNMTLVNASTMFFDKLSPDLKMWWNNPMNYPASNYIMTYLNANNTTLQNMQDASDFAIALTEYCQQNSLYDNEAEDFISQFTNYLINGGNLEFANWAIDCLSETFYDNSFEELLNISNLEQDYRSRMSTSELDIFDNLNWKQQYYYLLSAKNASDKAEELFPTTLHNGKGDAYRHALWNALSTKRIGKVLTENLTDAHENRIPGYSFEFKEIQMDLYNNLTGRQIANSNSSGKLWLIVKNSLENGDLMELSPLGLEINGIYYGTLANQNSILVPTN